MAMPLDWRGVVGGMTRVQKLVHLAARYDPVDEERIKGELLAMRRQAYDQELTIQARHVNCTRQGRLTNSRILSDLTKESERDAASIVNTYNYYLAHRILAIFSDVPRANRFTYAARLRGWYPNYWGWKQPQITEHTVGTARARAQRDFYQRNKALGSAKLEPRSAVCPICEGWIARGIVPLSVALNNPPPYHPNCPHVWDTRPNVVASEDCQNLWMGE
jgi:hypothetical protein